MEVGSQNAQRTLSGMISMKRFSQRSQDASVCVYVHAL